MLYYDDWKRNNHPKNKVVGEEKAHNEIYNYNPNAKIIICLRNPVEAEKEWKDKEAYLEQLQYANTKILEVVDKTLENSTMKVLKIILF